MYSREIGDDLFTFGVSGKLIRNTLVMYDAESDSLWSQLLGRAVEGPLEGTELTYVPAVHTTWAAWKAEYPETLALAKGGSSSYDSYGSYYASASAGVLGETYTDDRLYIKEFVVGVEQDGTAIAFPFSTLTRKPLVNDWLGETPILVHFDPQTGASRVFNRRAGSRLYTFSLDGPDHFVDQETGTRWSALDGHAVMGPRAGEQLDRVKSTTVFWFAWKDWYPETTVFDDGPQD